MPCPVCDLPIGHPASDHRWCVLDLLKSGQIKSSDEWTKMASDKPVTIHKGRVKAMIPKNML